MFWTKFLSPYNVPLTNSENFMNIVFSFKENFVGSNFIPTLFLKVFKFFFDYFVEGSYGHIWCYQDS